MANNQTGKSSRANWAAITALIVIVLAMCGGIVYITWFNNPMITVTQDQSNIEIKKGQEFTLKLNSNQTTGYSWDVDGTYDTSIITKTGYQYVTDSSNLAGAPGTELWTFKGEKAGTTTLTFKYFRSWEGASSAINTKTYNVTVK